MLLIGSIAMNAQVPEFQKFSGKEGYSCVYISKAMLRFASTFATPEVPGMNMKKIASKLDAIQIIGAESTKPATDLRTTFNSVVKRDKYELLMQMSDEGDEVNIYFHDGQKKSKSVIAMLTDDGDEVAAIIFSGSFTTEDINKLSETASRQAK